MSGKFNFHLSGFQLKLIALVTMFIDHIGVLCPNMFFLRYIGRLSFPIFAFLFSEGFYYTKNKAHYISRVFIFAVVSEIPHDLFFSGDALYLRRQNILFTFIFAFFALLLYERFKLCKKEWLGIFGVLVIALLAECFCFDYGAFGILLVFSFYFCRSDKAKANSFFVANGLLLPMLLLVCFKQGLPYSILSLVFIYLYSGNKGRSMKFLFYIAYPLHLALLTFISCFLS